MVLVSLNLNEYRRSMPCLPAPYPFEQHIQDCKIGVFVIKSLLISHFQIDIKKSW